MPVQSGPLTLYFPKFIPGEHGPTGPINGLAGLVITSGGRRIAWHRDAVDMNAFHADIPASARHIKIHYDLLSPIGGGRFTVKNQGRVERFSIDYHGPLKYPQLVRIKGTPDYLDQILAPKKG